jgi:hypothetical protein
MPSNHITKDEIKCWILKLKHRLHEEESGNSKDIADRYLNYTLEKIEEYKY